MELYLKIMLKLICILNNPKGGIRNENWYNL
jgi:hypothetical protein